MTFKIISNKIVSSFLITKEEIGLMKTFLKTLKDHKLFQLECENNHSIKHPLHSSYFRTTRYSSIRIVYGRKNRKK